MTAPFISTDNASCEDVAGSLDDPKSQGKASHDISTKLCQRKAPAVSQHQAGI